MVWITMSLAPHSGSKKRKKNDAKPHSQINKCLNEKRRREQENIHLEELAELVSASPSDMTSNPHKQDKCAILKETVNQIRSQKQSTESELCDDLQQSEVSSSKPNIINNQIFGSILLEALEGFLFVVNIEGKVEFVSENIISFLKFEQNDVLEKNIFDFIHPDDRPRFNSNLLLMMPVGNGRSGDWPSENVNYSGKPTKHFNCRFLVRSEEPEIKMENKQSVPLYENLNITANYIPLGNDGDIRNGLTCIARRVAVEEKRIGINKVEQFTTRIDREGKVIDVDISVLSSVNGQYLKKELTGAVVLDFCHPSDVAMFSQHLKEALENGHSTCNPFKFRVSRDKYAKVKTKSKKFQGQTAVGDIIISTHSIIRDFDGLSLLDSQKSVSSPSSVASSSSGPGSVSDSSISVNGGVALSPLTMSNSYGGYSASTPQNSADFGLGDLVLDMFPNSNWPMDQNSSQMKESDLASATSFVSSPQAAPSSNRSSETSATASPTNSAFVPGLASSRSGSSVPSPAMQSRTPTPFGGSCYSPSASQSSGGRSSPPRALPSKMDILNCSSSETLGNSTLSPGIRQDRQFDLKSNPKLRNLLTQTGAIEDTSLRSMSRQTSQEVTVIGESSRSYGDPPNLLMAREALNASRPKGNVILRDLLNQEDEDDSEAPVEPIYGNRSDISSVPNPLLNVGQCKGTESGAQQRVSNNNMLRKLLNNDDGDRNYRKSQDIIHQLLIEGSGNKITSLQGDNRTYNPNAMNHRLLENSVPNQVAAESSHGIPDVTFISESSSSVKRKMPEKELPSSTAKRLNTDGSHAQLAGQNPMLASMLAQTPRSLSTVVPTSVVSTIMTQLPQERLPKNLEKKLVHTPYTTATTSTSTSQVFNIGAPQQQQQLQQKDIVTSDSRGHIMQTSVPYTLQSVKNSYLQQQVDKLLSLEESMLPPQLDLNFSTASSTIPHSSFVQQLASAPNVSAASSASFLTEATLAGVEVANSAQASDPVFAEILEQIYSLQEEHNVETCRAEDRAAILKLLGEVIESPPTNVTNQPSTSTQDLNEKIAISAIQKELMEGSAMAVTSRAAASVVTTQPGRPGTVQAQPTLTAEQIMLLQQQQQQLLANALPPNYSLVANRVKLPVTSQSQMINTTDLLSQAQHRSLQIVRNTYVNLGNNPQLRKSLKQKAYLQQQQKRLLEQQQKQHLTMQTQQPLDMLTASNNPFPENMNDLLNNTVAPNVTLLRSSDVGEVPGSSRFSSNPVPSPTGQQTSPSPSQLSPSAQRISRSPFSQQGFPSQTPPTYSSLGPSQSPLPPTTSPHLVLSPSSPQQWNRPATSPIQQNLQLQNPMLNAQLSSQTSIGSNQQIRLTAQQRQQLSLRTASNTMQSIRSSQSDSNYPPLSPIMVLQQQQQQQRIQRTISVPERIAIVSQSQPNFSSNDSVLSSPTYAAASTSSIPSSPAVPHSFTSSQNSIAHFTFEGQNIQVFASSPNEINLRSPTSIQVSADLNRQELRQVLNSRNQVAVSAANVIQQLPSGSTTRVLNVQNISREALEELGLSLNLLSGADAQSSSQTLHSQALPNASNNFESASKPVVNNPRVPVEESRPSDQKKSLLQQLLSEPT